MVAQPQSSTARPTPLSYADRARNRSKNESLPPKPAVNGLSVGTLSPVNRPGPSKPSAAIKVPSPNLKHSPSLYAPSMRQPSTSNSSVRSAETNSTLLLNGRPPAVNGHPPSTSESITPSHPPVNIWSLRKEQMAQTQATQRPSAIPPAEDLPSSVPPRDRDLNTSSGLRGGAVSLRSIPSTNGASTLALENEDPFVVKSRNLQPSNPFPPVEDKESWPEVGSSIIGNTREERLEKAAKPHDLLKKGIPSQNFVLHSSWTLHCGRETQMGTGPTWVTG